MTRAAVPAYLGNNWSEAAPGHRFRLYFPGWVDEQDVRQNQEEAARRGRPPRNLPAVWDLTPDKKSDALRRCEPYGPASVKCLETLVGRQEALFADLGGSGLSIDAVSLAPFVTGVGMEHPIENGFAFLDPYGLPYLPGSSVKGVVRRAAEELALLADAPDWTVATFVWLFGFDGACKMFERGSAWREAMVQRLGEDDLARLDSLAGASLGKREFEAWQADRRAAFLKLGGSASGDWHLRGALQFWDVLPVPSSGKLHVDVMNPHFGKYYQCPGSLPTDDQEPKPLFYLGVPAGARFGFHVLFAPLPGVPDDLRSAWKPRVEQAFRHAFTWLGFGARTGGGAGRMCEDTAGVARREEASRRRTEARAARGAEAAVAREKAAREARLAALSPLERLLEELRTCGIDRVHAVYNQELPSLQGDDRAGLAKGLKEAYQRLGEWAAVKKPKQLAKVEQLKSILGEA